MLNCGRTVWRAILTALETITLSLLPAWAKCVNWITGTPCWDKKRGQMKAELPAETQNCLYYIFVHKCQRRQLSRGDVHTQDCHWHKVGRLCILHILEAPKLFGFNLIYCNAFVQDMFLVMLGAGFILFYFYNYFSFLTMYVFINVIWHVCLIIRTEKLCSGA